MPSVRSTASESDSEAVYFRFPDEGSYLHEAVDGKRTPLMNESLDQDDDSNAAPLRILKDFVIFDPRNLELTSLSCLSDDLGFCEAFGWALAVSDEADQDDRDPIQDDGVLLHISNILKWSLDIHEESLLILTQYAWYILQTPSPNYRQFFFPFYQKETLLRIVLRSVAENPSVTLPEFLQLLSMPAARDRLMDRCWTKADLFSHFQYSRSELQSIVHDVPGISWKDVKSAPLFSALLHGSEPFDDTPDTRRVVQKSSRSTPSRIDRAPPEVSQRTRSTKKIQKISTTLTPTIHLLISSYFDVKFTVVGQRPEFLDDTILLRGQPQNHGCVDSNSEVDLKPGDFVLVNEGNHWDKSQLRFAQVIFLDRRGKTLHARWFVHGSQTILEELAFGQELFLSVADHCRDVAVDCVVSKCKVMRISLFKRSNLQWPAEDIYFYSSAWDKHNPVDFIEVKDEQVRVPSSRICKTCDSRKSQSSYFISSFNSVVKHHEYHQHDFIRYQATDQGQSTCSFGQIITFHDFDESLQIKVHRLGRISERKEKAFCVENELFLTQIEEVVDAKMILGGCQVSHISQLEDRLTDCTWLEQHPLNFYLQYQAESLSSPLTPLPSTALHACEFCEKDWAALEKLDLQCRKEKSLRAFDPFAGVGGFGLGLSRGCSMHTTFGVELNINAAETMRKNFPPETTVLNEDANQVLERVVQGHADVPQNGEIDLIYTGPPCQNDSTLNMHKNDRKCLAFTALSFLDVLRPPFFIMESVPGLLQWKVRGTTHDINAVDLKLVLKVLHFLGYNVMGRLIHARSFGIPQTRNRFFIVATLPEYGDFKFPEVTHTFKPGQPVRARERLGSDLKINVAISPTGCALHEVVTTAEALSDLPLFDWTRPNESKTPHSKEEANTREKRVPTVSCDPDELWGIQDNAFRYNSPPANFHQQRARWNLGLSDPQYQHYTKHLPPAMVRNVCDLPLTRGADYRHLDQSSREWLLRDPASAKAIAGYQGGAYTRLNPDEYFHTIVTQVGPVAKQSAVVHPFCRRIFTVRELARAQGFPDDFVFYSETGKIEEYLKQIGNSVPFAVSAALGRSIQEVVFRRWMKEKDGEGRDTVDIES